MALANEADWLTLFRAYEAAVDKFETLSATLRRTLARFPAEAEFLELIATEQRAREKVLAARRRLIEFWHDSLDDTIPVRILKPDHVCDRRGPTETVVDETSDAAIVGLYPTCSVCGVPQLIPVARRER